jgi:CubicO group peptidase (beta-lactamase class C family)
MRVFKLIQLKFKPFGILFIIFLCPCIAQAQQPITDTIQKLLIKSKVAGAAITVIKNEEVVYSGNYGYADIANNIPVSDNTEFGIMSLSKNFVACAVLQLSNNNKINLDASVLDYIYELPKLYAPVKIYQLLNHTSGVPDYVHVKGYMQHANKSQTPLAVLNPIFNDPLEFVPGTKNDYSNSNYMLLGILIERVSGKKLKDYLNEMIFQPLGMKHTYLEENIMGNRDKAKGYTLKNDHLAYQEPLDPSQYWAAGGIVSTKNDMLLYHKALISGRLLSMSIVKTMMTPVKLGDGTNSEYGLGFELMQTPELEMAGNTGVGLGYNAAYLDFFKDDITIIILTNTTNGNSALIAKQIHDAISSNHVSLDKPNQDNLDEMVKSVFKNALQGNAEQANFQDAEILEKFKQTAIPYIQQHGELLTVEQKGEKKNPERVIRRYQITFKNSASMWVIIFSKEGKIIMFNHME